MSGFMAKNATKERRYSDAASNVWAYTDDSTSPCQNTALSSWRKQRTAHRTRHTGRNTAKSMEMNPKTEADPSSLLLSCPGCRGSWLCRTDGCWSQTTYRAQGRWWPPAGWRLLFSEGPLVVRPLWPGLLVWRLHLKSWACLKDRKGLV